MSVVHGSDDAVRDAAFSEGGFVPGEEYAIEPLLTGTVYEHKTRLQHTDITLAGRAAVIRTADWTYISRVYEGDELYDRRADPGERANLFGQAGTEGAAAALRTRLLEWMLATSDVVPHERDPRMDAGIMGALFAPR
jgi:arylsulfatase A-like enzyme